MTAPILTFDEVERLRVQIEGKVYELNAPDDFNLEQQADLNPCWKHLFAYMGALQEGLTPEIVGDLKYALDKGVRALLRDCPEEVIDRLTDARRIRIAMHFLEHSGLYEQAVEVAREALKPLPRRTGASSSPGSKRPTAATPKAG